MVVRPVPPLLVASVPTALFTGTFVALVRFTADGVSRFGLVSDGEFERTTLPDPVEPVSVGACAAEPVPVEVTNSGVVVVFPAR